MMVAALVPLAGKPLETDAQAGYSIDEFNIQRRDNDQLRPRISGRYVVWQDYRNLPGKTYLANDANADVYGRDLDNNSDFKVTSNQTAARPAVSGSKVVYTDSRDKDKICSGTDKCKLDLRGYDIESDDSLDVYQRVGDQDYPSIDGDLVVFQDNRNGNWDIRGVNLDGDDRFEVAVRDADQIHPDISGKVVVWEDYRDSGGPDIYMLDMDNDDNQRITSNNDSRDPAISGDWIVWRSGNPDGDNQRIRLYNRKTGERRDASDRQRMCGGPDISGNLVVWADKRNDEDCNLWGYDIAAGKEFKILTADRNQQNPVVSNGRTAWEDNRGDQGVDIRGARISVPAGPTATPVPGSGPPAPLGGPCDFTLGFRILRDMIVSSYGDIIGTCLENEWHNAENGDGLQRVTGRNGTGGLFAWRKLDNWTAYTDGATTWLNGPCGLQTRPNQGPFFPWEGRPGGTC
jgi:beta propeller repeat protein